MTPTERSALAFRIPRRLALCLDGLVVLWWLAIVELVVRSVPLPRLSTMMGTPLVTDDPPLERSGHPQLTPAEGRRLRMLDAVAPHWPFCDGPCLRQALVAGRVLKRHGPRLRIGAALDGDAFMAHAWLEVGAVDVGHSDRFATLVASPRR